jgi:hypothetical protein
VALAADATSHLLPSRKVMQQPLGGLTGFGTGWRNHELMQADAGIADDQGLPIGNPTHDTVEPFLTVPLQQEARDHQCNHKQGRKVARKPAGDHYSAAFSVFGLDRLLAAATLIGRSGRRVVSVRQGGCVRHGVGCAGREVSDGVEFGLVLGWGTEPGFLTDMQNGVQRGAKGGAKKAKSRPGCPESALTA